jgi:Tol biopolymer transport system component
VATRSDLGSSFGALHNLAEINSTASDEAPSLTADELAIYFASRRADGAGQYDLWVATRTDTGSAFGAPENLTELNTDGYDASPGISADGSTSYFGRGTPGAADLFVARRTCP